MNNLKKMVNICLPLLLLTVVSLNARSCCAKKKCESKGAECISNKAENSLFDSIKIMPELAHYEIVFWGRQLSEHALFLSLMLEDDGSNDVQDLKDEAMDLRNEFEDFREEHAENPECMDVMNKILPLVEKLRDFKVRLQNLINSGVWIGWIYPDFIDHVINELDYFLLKLNGIPLTIEQEVAFWNEINGDHAGFTAHLLDPQEDVLVGQANEFANRFEALEMPQNEEQMFTMLSLNAAQELDAFQKQAKVASEGGVLKSAIHPLLLDHVIRENNRSIEMLGALSVVMDFAEELSAEDEDVVNAIEEAIVQEEGDSMMEEDIEEIEEDDEE